MAYMNLTLAYLLTCGPWCVFLSCGPAIKGVPCMRFPIFSKFLYLKGWTPHWVRIPIVKVS